MHLIHRPGRPSYFEAAGSPQGRVGVPPRASFVNQVRDRQETTDVPASPGPGLPGARWLRRPCRLAQRLAPHSGSGGPGVFRSPRGVRPAWRPWPPPAGRGTLCPTPPPATCPSSPWKKKKKKKKRYRRWGGGHRQEEYRWPLRAFTCSIFFAVFLAVPFFCFFSSFHHPFRPFPSPLSFSLSAELRS